MNSKVILTFDLEFWYNTEFLKKYLPKNLNQFNDQVLESTLPLLKLLKKYHIKATFFVLGQLAEKYPGLIKKIHQDGHEIASHGYTHKILSELNPVKFEDEIIKSVNILKKNTGQIPTGFRAPDFSLTNKSSWVIPILEKHGFKYDSSIFPFKTKLYGNSQAPLGIYKISKNNLFKNNKNSKFIELPLAIYKNNLGIKIPIAGGFYFRFINLFFYKKLLQLIIKKRNPVIYIHPHELYNFIPDIKAPFYLKKLKYWGVDKSYNKFEALLKSFNFISIEEYLKNDNIF